MEPLRDARLLLLEAQGHAAAAAAPCAPGSKQDLAVDRMQAALTLFDAAAEVRSARCSMLKALDPELLIQWRRMCFISK